MMVVNTCSLFEWVQFQSQKVLYITKNLCCEITYRCGYTGIDISCTVSCHQCFSDTAGVLSQSFHNLVVFWGIQKIIHAYLCQ